MSDFQVGDRVSVEGVVTGIEWVDFGNVAEYVGVDLPGFGETTFRVDQITLVERPKRKLRVGSVWERWGVLYCVGTDGDGYKHLVSLKDGGILDASLIGVSHPECWREVPVEELERVADR